MYSNKLLTKLQESVAYNAMGACDCHFFVTQFGLDLCLYGREGDFCPLHSRLHTVFWCTCNSLHNISPSNFLKPKTCLSCEKFIALARSVSSV